MLSNELRSELEAILVENENQLGEIFRLKREGITSAKEIVEKSSVANRGVVYNYYQHLDALLEGKMPGGATVTRSAASTVGGLIKNYPEISEGLRNYLLELRETLLNHSASFGAVQKDREALEKQSEKLAAQANSLQSGIYVYSFPTYLHYGTIEDSDVCWLKIGSTKNSVWQRIVEQNRQTSMPEDPVLLRLFHKDGMNVDEIEKKFHTTIERFGHERSAARRTKAGKEWFATTLDAVDALAELMELTIEKYEELPSN